MRTLLLFAICTLALCGLPDSQLVAQTGLYITEVDYDQPGTDNAEWIEIWNGTDVRFDTEGIDLVLYDAALSDTCAEYCRVDLSPIGGIAEYRRIVIGSHPCALLPLCSSIDAIQNGVPDAITLENANGYVLHSVEYGSDLVNSVCSFSLTTATDVDSVAGSIEFCVGWSFSAEATPCGPCDE